MSDKSILRARLRAARDAAAMAGGGPMPVPVAFAARLGLGVRIAAYIPVGGEADPARLVAAARDAGGILALPHVIDRPSPIRFLRADGPLVAGPFGLWQPAADAAEVVPDIILTPLVGFDRRGNRLGQGAGHYDRAFASHPAAWRVGIAWSAQQVASLVPDPWDVPLHAIATEREWIVP